MLLLNLAQGKVQSEPRPPQRCPRCPGQTWQQGGRVRERPLTATRVKTVITRRYRCSHRGKTVTARPPGVSRAGRSRPFTALLGVLYALALSHRSIELAVAFFGSSVDPGARWRDLQRLGRLGRRRLPAGRVRIGDFDATRVKAAGR